MYACLDTFNRLKRCYGESWRQLGHVPTHRLLFVALLAIVPVPCTHILFKPDHVELLDPKLMTHFTGLVNISVVVFAFSLACFVCIRFGQTKEPKVMVRAFAESSMYSLITFLPALVATYLLSSSPFQCSERALLYLATGFLSFACIGSFVASVSAFFISHTSTFLSSVLYPLVFVLIGVCMRYPPTYFFYRDIGYLVPAVPAIRLLHGSVFASFNASFGWNIQDLAYSLIQAAVSVVLFFLCVSLSRRVEAFMRGTEDGAV